MSDFEIQNNSNVANSISLEGGKRRKAKKASKKASKKARTPKKK